MILLKKQKLFISLIIILAVSVLLVYALKKPTLKTQLPKTIRPELTIDEIIFNIELADTEAKQRRGLSGKEMIAENEGMFFVFDVSDDWGIWMKDMKFAIDIIWLDQNLTIIDLVQNVEPQTYPKVFRPHRPARYVLEISAGQIERLKIKIGDQVKLSGLPEEMF